MKIKKHTKRYIHIPFSWPAIGRFFAVLATGTLAVLNFFLIISTWKLLSLGSLNESDITGFHQLLILYPLIGEYVLIGLLATSIVACIKGGYKNLNRYSESGLIVGLIFGLIGGLIGGLIVGLIFGLIVGLIVGLIGGLIVGLIFGLEDEFKN